MSENSDTLRIKLPFGQRAPGSSKMYGTQRKIRKYEVSIVPGRVIQAKQAFNHAARPMRDIEYALQDRYNHISSLFEPPTPSGIKKEEDVLSKPQVDLKEEQKEDIVDMTRSSNSLLLRKFHRIESVELMGDELLPRLRTTKTRCLRITKSQCSSPTVGKEEEDKVDDDDKSDISDGLSCIKGLISRKTAFLEERCEQFQTCKHFPVIHPSVRNNYLSEGGYLMSMAEVDAMNNGIKKNDKVIAFPIMPPDDNRKVFKITNPSEARSFINRPPTIHDPYEEQLNLQERHARKEEENNKILGAPNFSNSGLYVKQIEDRPFVPEPHMEYLNRKEMDEKCKARVRKLCNGFEIRRKKFQNSIRSQFQVKHSLPRSEDVTVEEIIQEYGITWNKVEEEPQENKKKYNRISEFDKEHNPKSTFTKQAPRILTKQCSKVTLARRTQHRVTQSQRCARQSQPKGSNALKADMSTSGFVFG